ncbi:MAG TPA: endonuclease/exonuclease/phosphatase family protein [Verrucomicrobiae bacterium]|nr:endonuclease/exonuclease/phosphatase family protein [Verrucomicrobiae bacterium]
MIVIRLPAKASERRRVIRHLTSFERQLITHAVNPRLNTLLCLAVLTLSPTLLRAETFRIAAYNLENYLDQPTESRHSVKSAEAKAKIRESIRALKPDVISFEEMGSTNALLELRASLKAEGLDFPYWEHVSGFDTNIHVAVLSRFPITARHPHTNEHFLLDGRRFSVSRGFLEVNIQVNTNYSFTLLGAHLKSKRPVPEADQTELRLQEAKLLREKIDAILTANPNANLVVLGDFNDTQDSPSTKAIIGQGKSKLLDTRPAERNGDNAPNLNPRYSPMNVTWTYYYGVEDTYSRIDYILLSPGMAREWLKNGTYVLSIPNWGIGSDHRPIVAGFETENK